MKKVNIAVMGATGMVGRKMLEVLEERKLPIDNFYAFASKRSAGKTISFMGKNHTIIELTKENIEKEKIDYALFSAGGSTSKEFAPVVAACGGVGVDNSSYFRMDETVPLVVPEVNMEKAFSHSGIIANPNCSTIQAVVALYPLYKRFGIKRIIYSTYQAVSGAGVDGKTDLEEGIKGNKAKKFSREIFSNVIPQIDVFLENGYTKEEEKMIEETKKIFSDYKLKVTATTVRVPVFNGHSESVNVELKKKASLEEIVAALKEAKGVIVTDSQDKSKFISPLEIDGKDEVFVSRVRLDSTVKSGVNMWIVADNIRKGAATNAVQIVEGLIKNQ